MVINGYPIRIQEKHIAPTVLSMFIPHLEYMSIENICAMLIEISEMLYEAGVSGHSKTSAGYLARTGHTTLKRYENAETEEVRQRIYWNAVYGVIDIVMRGEGMAPLPGFGYAKVDHVEGRRKITGRYMINPEKTLTDPIKH